MSETDKPRAAAADTDVEVQKKKEAADGLTKATDAIKAATTSLAGIVAKLETGGVTVEDQLGYYTEKAGDVGRNLALGGIAALWIFKTGSAPPFTLPAPLLTALHLFALGLAVDAFQYVAGSLGWGFEYFLRSSTDKARQRWGWSALLTVTGIIRFGLLACGFCILAGYASEQIVAQAVSAHTPTSATAPDPPLRTPPT